MLTSFINRSFSKLFKLDPSFISLYKNRPVNFGFNGLGDLVYRRTYSRVKEDGSGENEKWYETVQRVVEGSFNMLNDYCDESAVKIPKEQLDLFHKQAKIMYDKIFNFKFLPPGRGLWTQGTNLILKKKLYTTLNNCAFISTKPINRYNIEEILNRFAFLMDCAMLGVGVGFDTKGAQANIKIYQPNKDIGKVFVIKDSREGWVDSLKYLLNCFLKENQPFPRFDYHLIRKAGVPLKSFGGVSSGAWPLIELHKNITGLLTKHKGETMNTRIIVDIMNFIGKTVVSGNIRRTAEIALGEADDDTFIELKNYKKNPDRMSYGWLSNNSIYAKLGMDYSKVCENINNNGEPGLMWLDNMRKYSRMCDPPTWADRNAAGGNPCLEQTLESYEMCCLVETFPAHHNTLEEFIDTLKYAFLYAKIVTLGLPHWKETAEVLSRNRRIGVSMTGIAQFLCKQNGISELKKWCDGSYKFLKQYDSHISKIFNVPESIKITSIKPSGTVSLLGGATPGIHFPHSRFYIRRVRVPSVSPLIPELKKNGYHVEPDFYQGKTTSVVSFPVDLGKGIRTIKDTNIWEQLSLCAFMQRYWADNQVSCTVSFDKEKEGNQIKTALDYYQYHLKGISFLPLFKSKTAYPQMPYEEINESQYKNMRKKITIKNIEGNLKESEKEISHFCDSEHCELL